MIFGCISVYNEAVTIEMCVSSLRPHVDYLIVVDGAYAKYPHEAYWSTDGTLERLEAMSDVDIIYAPGRAWTDQVEKRTAYLIGAENDFYFHLDSDEVVTGALPWNLTEDVYKVRVINVMTGGRGWATRVWRHRIGMMYHGAHCALVVDDRVVNRLESAAPLESVVINHLVGVRGPARLAIDDQFQKEQATRERAFRQRHGI